MPENTIEMDDLSSTGDLLALEHKAWQAIQARNFPLALREFPNEYFAGITFFIRFEKRNAYPILLQFLIQEVNADFQMIETAMSTLIVESEPLDVEKINNLIKWINPLQTMPLKLRGLLPSALRDQLAGIETIKQQLQDYVKVFLERFDAALKSNNFSLAEDLTQRLSACTLMSLYPHLSETAKNEVAFDRRLEEAINLQIENYHSVSFVDYDFAINILIEKLKQCKDLKFNKSKTMLNEIAFKGQAAFDQLDIKSQDFSATLARIDRVLGIIPEDIKQPLQEKRLKITADRKRLENEFETALANVKTSQDLMRLFQEYHDFPCFTQKKITAFKLHIEQQAFNLLSLTPGEFNDSINEIEILIGLLIEIPYLNPLDFQDQYASIQSIMLNQLFTIKIKCQNKENEGSPEFFYALKIYHSFRSFKIWNAELENCFLEIQYINKGHANSFFEKHKNLWEQFDFANIYGLMADLKVHELFFVELKKYHFESLRTPTYTEIQEDFIARVAKIKSGFSVLLTSIGKVEYCKRDNLQHFIGQWNKHNNVLKTLLAQLKDHLPEDQQLSIHHAKISNNDGFTVKWIEYLEKIKKVFEKEYLSRDDCQNINEFKMKADLVLMLDDNDIKRCVSNFTKDLIDCFLEGHFKRINANIEFSGKPDLLASDLTKNLIYMKSLSCNLFFKNEIDAAINTLLSPLSQLRQGALLIFMIGNLLNNDLSGNGKAVILEHPFFKDHAICLANMKKADIQKEDVLQLLGENEKNSHLNIAELSQAYDDFDLRYHQLLSKNINISTDHLRMIVLGMDCPEPYYVMSNNESQESIPHQMARIFVVWTLMNTSPSLKILPAEQRSSYLFKPYPTQVIAIFCLLGIGYTNHAAGALVNNLIEIATGEGKSIVLAVAAIILARRGFDVYSACYSEHLSSRDQSSFTKLFTLFNVKQQINYGSFDTLCGGIINSNFSVRGRMIEIISSPELKRYSAQEFPSRRILLIDEVDVFFQKNFYGEFYKPLAHLRGNFYGALINFIWEHRQSDDLLNLVKKSEPFLQLCTTTFSGGWDFLLENEVSKMVCDVLSFEDHGYVVHEGKIGYTDLDSINCRLHQGYKTLFAYRFESEKGTIAIDEYNSLLGIHVLSGDFSYVEMSKMFTHIMGVTGTLRDIDDLKKLTIREQYGVAQTTYMPSVYRVSRFHEEELTVINQDSYFPSLYTAIEEKIKTKTPVLIFFKNKKLLTKFHRYIDEKSVDFKYLNVMDESLSSEMREVYIKQATSAEQVTLLTRAYGRGTDFICYDADTVEAGGVHVIQTFFSGDKTEERQIKGRTARQGEKGSYQMILLDEDLEKTFSFSKEEIDAAYNQGTLYAILDNKRAELSNYQHQQQITKVEAAMATHQDSLVLLENLRTGNVTGVQDYMKRKYASEPINLSKAPEIPAPSSLPDNHA